MKTYSYIYADNAATTRIAPEVLEAMMPYFTNEYGNASSLYSFSRPAKLALQKARETIANCIGALPEEILFTSGGTESNNWVIKGRMILGKISTSCIEHHSILNSLAFCDKYPHIGCGRVLSVNKEGVISLKSLENAISHRVSLVSAMLANNEIGTIEPIREIATIAHRYGAACHTDAVQALGHIPVNVNDLGVDFLSASAHKFRGPKGIGFLYSRQNVFLEDYMTGGQQEFGFRAGTENVASIVGMATALKLCCDQMEETNLRLGKMVSVFQRIIKEAVPEASFNGDPLHHLPGHISLSIAGISGEGLLHFLDLKGIAVSTGAACNSNYTEISHVLRAIRLPVKKAQGTIRITFGADNQEDDPLIIARNIIDYIYKEKGESDA